MPGGCIEWTGFINPNGYGKFWLDGAHVSAHRAAWLLAKGPIPKGTLVCHHCDNRRCVNVDHMFLGTHQDNASDMAAKGRWGEGVRVCGTRVNTAKLTEDDVRRMRALRDSGWTYKRLSAEFGIGVATVQKTCVRTYWKHVA